MNRLHNLSNEMLADMIGAADREAKAAAKALDDLKAEFKARSAVHAIGSSYEVTVAASSQIRLDTKLLREHFDCSAYETTIHTRTLRVQRIEEAILAA